jgi:hypothetical protein
MTNPDKSFVTLRKFGFSDFLFRKRENCAIIPVAMDFEFDSATLPNAHSLPRAAAPANHAPASSLKAHWRRKLFSGRGSP